MTKDEETAILAVLEEDYATGRAAAAAVLRVVKDLLAKRDNHVVGVNVGSHEHPRYVAFGPFWDQNELKKFRGMAVLPTETQKVFAPAGLDSADYTPLCPRCNHPGLAHTFGTECVVSGCGCKSVRNRGGWRHAEENETDAAENTAA